MPVDFGDSLEVDEAWTFVQSKRKRCWVWCATSYLTGQIWAVQVAGRNLKTLRTLWNELPKSKRWIHLYTDLYPVYHEFFSPQFAFWHHHACPKGSGETNRAEGTNTALRARVSYLIRKTTAFARSLVWLQRRIRYFVHHYNLERKRKLTRSL